MTLKPHLIAAACTVLAASMGHAAPLALSSSARDGSEGRYIVVFNDASAARASQDARAQLRTLGVAVHRDLPRIAAVAASLTAAQLAQMRSHPGVAYVEPDVRRYPSSSKAMAEGAGGAGSALFDAEAALAPLGKPFGQYTTPAKAPYVKGQRLPYALTQAQLPATLAGATRTPTDVKICVIDSGIDRSHEDFAGIPITGDADAKAGSWYEDGYGHGTHVAGTMVAVNQRGVGVVGAAPSGHVAVHAVKVFNDDGLWSYTSDVIDAVHLCQNAGAKLINMSMGGFASSKAEAQAMQQAEDAGVLMVGSAGNNFGSVSSNYPASYPSVISVASLKPDGTRVAYSQRHATVELAAGGWEVLSTYPTGKAGTAKLSVAGTNVPLPRWVLGTPSQGSGSGALAPINSFKPNPALAGKVCYFKRRYVERDPTYMIMDQIIAACQASGGVGFIAGNDVPGSLWGMYQKSKYNPLLHIPAVVVQDTVARQIEANMGQTASLSVTPTHYAYEEGTSMATPLVTGTAATLWSYFPECSNKQIRATLGKTAKDLGATGRDIETGFGLIQAKAAYDRLNALGCEN